MIKNYSKLEAEERANVLSHGVGLTLLITLTIYFLFFSGKENEPIIYRFSSLTFLVASILMMIASCGYHLQLDICKKKRWRIYDHICILLLIGASYGPFITSYYWGESGKWFLATLWGIILLAAIYKLFLIGKYDWVSLFIYLLLGWLVVTIYGDITENMQQSVHHWLVTGGVFYTAGTIFYKWESLRFNHAIWHLFVLGGILSHFTAILFIAK